MPEAEVVAIPFRFHSESLVVPKGGCPRGSVSAPSPLFQRLWRRRVGFGWIFSAAVAALLLLTGALGWAQTDVISEINVTGNRRIPAETIKARVFTKAGDIYDPAALERDFNSLWNTGYFEDIKILREQTPKGWRIIVQVQEKPTIREINYT